MIVAGVCALLGSFLVTAPAQAGYYEDSYYAPRPCGYRCGSCGYRCGYGYAPRYHYYHGCSSCGCSGGCYRRPGLVYEKRYIEREYVERRYGYGWGHPYYRRHYGYYPYGGYGGYYRRPFPYGYGGVRGWRSPYGYRYEPSYYRYAEEPPRPPAPVPYGYDGDQY